MLVTEDFVVVREIGLFFVEVNSVSENRAKLQP